MKMKKHILYGVLLSTASCYAYGSNENYKFNIGAQGGYLSQFADLKRTPDASLKLDGNYKSKISDESASGGVFAGVIYNKNNLHLGIELFLNYAESSASLDNERITLVAHLINKLTMTHTLGASALIGYKIQSTTPYLKVGIVNTRWKFNCIAKTDEDSMSKTYKKYKVGLHLAAGMDVDLKENFKIGMEFSHSRYEKLSHKSKVCGSVTVKPRANTFMIRFSYVFNI